MDAVTFLIDQHRELESLFQEYEAAPDGPDAKLLFDRTEIAVVNHAAIEELHVYPAIRDRVINGGRLADHALQDHQVVKETLDELESLEPGSPEFDLKMRKVISAVREHIEEEEDAPGLFPLLRNALSLEQIEELGKTLEKAAKMTPTHPHPGAPNKPPANKIAGVAAAALDKTRDALTGRGKR